MTSTVADPTVWPRRRWWTTLLLVFAAQLGLIFALSDRHPIRPRTARQAPTLHMVTAPPAELLALTDATLFALPHRQGFAGLAWLKIPRIEVEIFDWSEAPDWLKLDASRLGEALTEFSETNLVNSLPTLTLPEPQLLQPQAGSLTTGRTASTLRVEGMSGRRMITPLELAPQPNNDILTNSIIQIVVDADGRLISVPVLLAGSGSKKADDDALQLARSVRFEPERKTEPQGTLRPMADASWGKLIFEWNTVPAITPAGPLQ